jgi:hypothetical protein
VDHRVNEIVQPRVFVKFSNHGLICNALQFGWLPYGEPNAITNAIDAKFFSSSHGAVIRVFDGPGNVIKTHEYKSDFKEP